MKRSWTHSTTVIIDACTSIGCEIKVHWFVNLSSCGSWFQKVVVLNDACSVSSEGFDIWMFKNWRADQPSDSNESFPSTASQASCEKEELRQFPFRLLDWLVHLRDTDEFGTTNLRKSLATLSDAERRKAAQVIGRHIISNFRAWSFHYDHKTIIKLHRHNGCMSGMRVFF